MNENTLAHNLQNVRPIDLARERVETLVNTANEWIAKVPEIRDEETAKRADDFLNQIQAELKKLDVEEKAEKQPLRDQITEIGQRYLHPRALLNTARDLLAPRLGSWLRRVRDKAEAEKRRQQQEALELQRQAIDAATKAKSVEAIVRAEELTKAARVAADIAARPPERAQVRGNYSTRARSIRTLWRASITDQLQLYVYYAEHSDVVEVLQRLANAEAPAAHREGRAIPGCALIEKEIAA